MSIIDWRRLKGLSRLFTAAKPEPGSQAERIVAMQLHIVLPTKAGVIAVVLYYLFYSGWLYGPLSLRELAQQALQRYFLIYVGCNCVAALVFARWRRFPPGMFQWLVFVLGLLDGLFMAGLTFITGGFQSIAYWMFPGLIVLNAVSIPLAMPQIVLNVLLTLFYLGAGILDATTPYQVFQTPRPAAFRTPAASRPDPRAATNSISAAPETGRVSRASRPLSWVGNLPYGTVSEENPLESPEPTLPRLFVLWLLTACCYGLQLLAERHRSMVEEEREFAVREAQLKSAGRLAAEIAHQLKNPLAIINNTIFSLRRALEQGRPTAMDQIKMIQEEIERADRFLTDLMGYAQLTEGRVEKLNVIEELDYAVQQVFPPAADFGIQIHRNYSSDLPPLLMQRRHFVGIVVNLLQNAREALQNGGKIEIMAVSRPDSSVEISVRDDGPGIPPDQSEKIFEAHYTTKEKGTGLGLAIVRHNIELYAGTVHVESELGKGARFILEFPAKTVMNSVKRGQRTL